MRRTHMDPAEAVQAFIDLGARWMMPIHFGTFVNSADAADAPLRELGAAALLAFGVCAALLHRERTGRP